MNYQKLKDAEGSFLQRYPGGFADPGMEAVKKKHNVDKLVEFAQQNLVRANFNRPEVFDLKVKAGIGRYVRKAPLRPAEAARI